MLRCTRFYVELFFGKFVKTSIQNATLCKMRKICYARGVFSKMCEDASIQNGMLSVMHELFFENV
jgi:hypothetical protein